MTLRQRTPREADRKYLAAVRQLPCLVCPGGPPCDAAHIRMADWLAMKPHTGKGQKPDDRWAVPLCHRCHMDQHKRGERVWWEAQGIDPIAVAVLLYAARPHLDRMISIIYRSRM
jgi:hypothetical protein